MKQLKVGDFVLTRRSVHPPNNGIRALIIERVQGRVIDGHPRPYTIVRIDGAPFPLLGSAPHLGPAMRGLCSGYYLKRLDLDGEDPRDKVLMGRDALADLWAAQAATKAAIERAAA